MNLVSFSGTLDGNIWPSTQVFFHLINCSLLSVLRTSKKAHIKLYRYRLCVNGLKCYSGVLCGEGESFLDAVAV